MRSLCKVFIVLVHFYFISTASHAQSNANYIKSNAIPIRNPKLLNDSVYRFFDNYRVIMVGEMHGANECAQFVNGLAALFTAKGDSIFVGLEIPAERMHHFITNHTDSSIYQSNFFSNYEPFDGRESFAWAQLIGHLKNNPNVHLFFFDIDSAAYGKLDRDSAMYHNIKQQLLQHPQWRMLTLSGSYHASLTKAEKKLATYLIQDTSLKLAQHLASVYNYYYNGSYNANSGGTFKEHHYSRQLNDWDTTVACDKYLIKCSPKSDFPYTAVYYTKTLTPSKMVKGNFNLQALKLELATIAQRDQKTRTGKDSSAYMHYIDSCLLVQVKALLTQYGWMGKSLVGAKANQALFLVIQHTDLETQLTYYSLLEQAVQEGESYPSELALLQDRIQMRQGDLQTYGTQVIFSKTGEPQFYPIANEKQVNQRRAKVGLQPIEEYAKYFGINYIPPRE